MTTRNTGSIMNGAVPLLDRLLTALDLRIETFARCEIFRGWQLTLQPSEATYVHYVLTGSGVLLLPDGRSDPVSELWLNLGDAA